MWCSLRCEINVMGPVLSVCQWEEQCKPVALHPSYACLFFCTSNSEICVSLWDQRGLFICWPTGVTPPLLHPLFNSIRDCLKSPDYWFFRIQCVCHWRWRCGYICSNPAAQRHSLNLSPPPQYKTSWTPDEHCKHAKYLCPLKKSEKISCWKHPWWEQAGCFIHWATDSLSLVTKRITLTRDAFSPLRAFPTTYTTGWLRLSVTSGHLPKASASCSWSHLVKWEVLIFCLPSPPSYGQACGEGCMSCPQR